MRRGKKVSKPSGKAGKKDRSKRHGKTRNPPRSKEKTKKRRAMVVSLASFLSSPRSKSGNYIYIHGSRVNEKHC